MSGADIIDQYELETPEPKLELIEGQLLIGNSRAGSRYTLHDLVTGWGTEAVLPLASDELWRSALHQAFAALAPPAPEAPLQDWQAWARGATFEPSLEPAGPMSTGPHHRARELLNRGLNHACDFGRFGTSLGRDFVMHLGDHGFTTDGLLVGRQATERLFSRYLNGPADLVLEVLLPGHERQDREVKRHFYEAGRVPDYWIVDPVAELVEFLHWAAGKYTAQPLGADGGYRPAGVPGLVFWPARLWQAALPREAAVFGVESPLPAGWSFQPQEGIEWDEVPFLPKPDLRPRVLRFDDYASWCPRAKFEGDGRRTIIGGHLGTRNVLGMLLRTFGLVEAVRVAPPRAWVAGLLQAEQAQRGDAERKARWWDLARRAAARLHRQHAGVRVAVIGHLVRPEPLHFWSELSLVVWGLPGSRLAHYDLLRKLDGERIIELINPDTATQTEQRQIETEAVEIG